MKRNYYILGMFLFGLACGTAYICVMKPPIRILDYFMLPFYIFWVFSTGFLIIYGKIRTGRWFTKEIK